MKEQKKPVPGKTPKKKNEYGNSGKRSPVSAHERVVKITLGKTETSYSVSSKLRDIGNSKGVILHNSILEKAGIAPEADLLIHASQGLIIIEARKREGVNTDLSTWDASFKKSIKKGKRPEPDIWKNLRNEFDEGEWK